MKVDDHFAVDAAIYGLKRELGNWRGAAIRWKISTMVRGFISLGAKDMRRDAIKRCLMLRSAIKKLRNGEEVSFQWP